MNSEIVQLLNDLFSTLGIATGAAISAYVWYYIAASLVWIVVAGIAYYFLFRVTSKIKDDEPRILLRSVASAVLFIIVVYNTSHLVAPEAMAIHRLISDVSGINK